jgi:hypothetical protein
MGHVGWRDRQAVHRGRRTAADAGGVSRGLRLALRSNGKRSSTQTRSSPPSYRDCARTLRRVHR